jgi:O-antigen/teichoic acid export membrane protein
LKNTITLINTFVGNTILYFMLTHGFGLLTLALGNCIGISLKYIIYFILLGSEKYGGYHFCRKNFSKTMLKTLVRFGAKTFVQSTASTISGSIGPLVVGFFLGPATVPFFTIPGRLVSYVRELSMTVTNVFLPVFSHLHAGGDRERQMHLYLVSTRFISGVIYPALIGVCLLGPAFITRWIGPEYGKTSSTLLLFITGSVMIYMINPLHQRFLTGIGRIEFLARIRVITAVALLISSLVLVKPFGKEGVAGAFFVVSLIFEPTILIYTCRQLGVSPKDFLLKAHLRLVVPNLVMGCILAYVTTYWDLVTYSRIVIVVAFCGVVYLLLFWFLSLSCDERLFLTGKIKEILA